MASTSKSATAQGASRCTRLRAIESLHGASKYADLTIETPKKIFRVHKTIVCTQSAFFEKACKDEWQTDKNDATVELDDENDCVVSAMIDFIYLSSYNDRMGEEADNYMGPMELNILLFIAADKYSMPDLAALSVEKFCARVDEFDLEEDFVTSVELLYGIPPTIPMVDRLREQVVKAATLHARNLLTTDSDCEESSLRILINSVPEFAEAVIDRLLSNARKREKCLQNAPIRTCIDCGTVFQINRPWTSSAIPNYCAYCKGNTRALEQDERDICFKSGFK